MSSNTKALIEAALFMSGRSIRVRELSEVVGVSAEDVKSAVESLAVEYGERGGGIVVGWDGRRASMHVRPELEDGIMSLAPATEMSQAMLKTLAVIATEGPVKQSDLVKRRGTRVYYYVKKLVEGEMVSAKKSGRSKLLSTTPKFREYFRINEVPKVEGSQEVELVEVASEEPAVGEAAVKEAAEENANQVEFNMK